MTSFELEPLARRMADRRPEEILEWALNQYDNIALSFSGAEDVVLVHMASRIRPGVPVFTLDTGRLHSETYRFIETVRDTYPIELEVLHPDAEQLDRLAREKGLFSFYRDGHSECCGIRKVGPLRRRLQALDAWITGQRQDQSPDTRAEVPVVQHDAVFSPPGRTLVKVNPLANWSSADLWSFIRGHDVPYNELHRKGFVSIGCEPCTRAVLPNQHEREGRWWWENSAERECGLHADNIRKAG
jgi:phosphoadenosine phosphosulfate reductase